MKLDDLIYDGIENTLDERLSQYSADLKKHHFSAAYKIRRHQTIRFIQGSENIREVLCQTHKICFACGNSCGIPADRIQYLVFGRRVYIQRTKGSFSYIYKQNSRR